MRMTDGLPTPRRYLAIVAVSSGTALAVIDGSIATVALPTLARDLHVDASLAVLVVTVYQLILVMTLLPFSALGHRVGLQRLYRYGQIVFIFASVLCFFAKSLPFLLVVRALQGLGAAASLSVQSALIRAIYPSNQLGRGLGIGSIVVSVSGAIAPSLGGLLLSIASWPWLFAAAAPLAAVSLWVGRRTLPEAAPRVESYDLAGALLCALTFGLTISGLESLVHGDSPVVAGAIVLAGIVVAVVFVRRELGESQPILPVDLLRQPVLAWSSAGALISFMASMTFMLSMPFRLQQDYGFMPGEVGAMLTPWPLAMMFVAPVAGVLSDRFPASVLGAIGMSIATVGLMLLAFLPAHATHFDIVWRVVCCGVGYGLFLAPNARLVVGSAPVTRAAAAGGLISTIRLTGQTLGATLLAALLSFGIGTDRTPAIVAAFLALGAAACSIARLRPPVHEKSATELEL
jgi:DHA2 family multidrug resistance protein-like MFS transporter